MTLLVQYHLHLDIGKFTVDIRIKELQYCWYLVTLVIQYWFIVLYLISLIIFFRLSYLNLIKQTILLYLHVTFIFFYYYLLPLLVFEYVFSTTAMLLLSLKKTKQLCIFLNLITLKCIINNKSISPFLRFTTLQFLSFCIHKVFYIVFYIFFCLILLCIVKI